MVKKGLQGLQGKFFFEQLNIEPPMYYCNWGAPSLTSDLSAPNYRKNMMCPKNSMLSLEFIWEQCTLQKVENNIKTQFLLSDTIKTGLGLVWKEEIKIILRNSFFCLI